MSVHSLVPRRGHRLILGAAIASCGVLLAACSSSPSASAHTHGSHHPSHTSHPKSSSTTTTTTMKKPAKASISSAISKLANGQNATFSATYTLSAVSDGKAENGTLTLAHSGSDSLFGLAATTGSFEEIVTGTKAVACSKQNGAWQCFGGAAVASLASAFATMEHEYSSRGELATLKSEEAGAFGVSTSTKTVAGQSTTCYSYHSHVEAAVGTVCITDDGQMASVVGHDSSGHFSLTLTKFSTSVPASQFTAPGPVTST